MFLGFSIEAGKEHRITANSDWKLSTALLPYIATDATLVSQQMAYVFIKSKDRYVPIAILNTHECDQRFMDLTFGADEIISLAVYAVRSQLPATVHFSGYSDTPNIEFSVSLVGEAASWGLLRKELAKMLPKPAAPDSFSLTEATAEEVEEEGKVKEKSSADQSNKRVVVEKRICRIFSNGKKVDKVLKYRDDKAGKNDNEEGDDEEEEEEEEEEEDDEEEEEEKDEEEEDEEDEDEEEEEDDKKKKKKEEEEKNGENSGFTVYVKKFRSEETVVGRGEEFPEAADLEHEDIDVGVDGGTLKTIKVFKKRKAS